MRAKYEAQRMPWLHHLVCSLYQHCEIGTLKKSLFLQIKKFCEDLRLRTFAYIQR